MKTLRIRKFMVIGMLSIITFPWISYFVVHFLDTGVIQPWGQANQPQQEAAINQVVTTISSQYPKWQDPSWQSTLRSELVSHNIEVVIQSPSGNVIFNTGLLHHWMPSQKISVVESGHQFGTILIFTHGTNDAVAAITALVMMIIAIFFAVGFQMRRQVIQPLEAMSHAARRIAEGDLDFALPVSRVTEIAEVRTAFHAMVIGLRESIEKQAKLEQERRFFIGAIAHDLRTPLFALRGYLEGLEQGIANTPEKIEKYVSVCKEKSKQLDRLVSDLFAFTKLEYMEQTLNRDKIDFVQVVEGSIDSVRPLAEDKDVEIVIESPDKLGILKAYDTLETPGILGTPGVLEAFDHPFMIKGDAHLLERAINNLLDNAIRHTPSHGKIFVRWHHEQGKTTITVRDTGPGFDIQDLEHIFEPLYRGDTSRNTMTGGAGLGLTIAKRIFKAHGGDLMAGNHLDGGAVLTGWIVD
jgi:signal transduction histidine kinase